MSGGSPIGSEVSRENILKAKKIVSDNDDLLGNKPGVGEDPFSPDPGVSDDDDFASVAKFIHESVNKSDKKDGVRPVTHMGEGSVGEPRTSTKDALDYFVNVSNTVTEWEGMADTDKTRVEAKWDEFIGSRLDDISLYAKDYPELKKNLDRLIKKGLDADKSAPAVPAEAPSPTLPSFESNPAVQESDASSEPGSASAVESPSSVPSSPDLEDKSPESSSAEEKAKSVDTSEPAKETSKEEDHGTTPFPEEQKPVVDPNYKVSAPNFGKLDDDSYGEKGPGDENLSEADLIRRRDARGKTKYWFGNKEGTKEEYMESINPQKKAENYPPYLSKHGENEADSGNLVNKKPVENASDARSRWQKFKDSFKPHKKAVSEAASAHTKPAEPAPEVPEEPMETPFPEVSPAAPVENADTTAPVTTPFEPSFKSTAEEGTASESATDAGAAASESKFGAAGESDAGKSLNEAMEEIKILWGKIPEDKRKEGPVLGDIADKGSVDDYFRSKREFYTAQLGSSDRVDEQLLEEARSVKTGEMSVLGWENAEKILRDAKASSGAESPAIGDREKVLGEIEDLRNRVKNGSGESMKSAGLSSDDATKSEASPAVDSVKQQKAEESRNIAQVILNNPNYRKDSQLYLGSPRGPKVLIHADGRAEVWTGSDDLGWIDTDLTRGDKIYDNNGNVLFDRGSMGTSGEAVNRP